MAERYDKDEYLDVIGAVNIMGGGEYREMAITPYCSIDSRTCTPDVLNKEKKTPSLSQLPERMEGVRKMFSNHTPVFLREVIVIVMFLTICILRVLKNNRSFIWGSLRNCRRFYNWEVEFLGKGEFRQRLANMRSVDMVIGFG